MSTLLSKRGQQRRAEISYCSWRNLPAHIARAGASGEGSSCYLFPSDRNAHKKVKRLSSSSSQLALLPPPSKWQKLVWWTPPIMLERLCLRAKQRVLFRPCCLNTDPVMVRQKQAALFPYARVLNLRRGRRMSKSCPGPDREMLSLQKWNESQPQSNSNLAVAAQQHFIATYPRVLIERFKYNVSDTSNYERSVTKGDERDVKFRL